MEKSKFHAEEETVKTTENEEEEEWTSIMQVAITGIFALGSFYGYFAGYTLRIKRLDLGEYSFLVVGILFALAFAYALYSYVQEQKAEKK